MMLLFDRCNPCVALSLLVIAAAVLVGCAGTPAPIEEPNLAEVIATFPQPYAGLESRPIKAIEPDRVEDILAGRCAGYALSAELNSYPGPTHILQMSEPLELSDAQKFEVEAIFKTMNSEAKILGNSLITLEADLEQLFREEKIDQTNLVELTSQISDVDGQLRALHLGAHLTMKDVLIGKQVQEYDVLRGYSDSPSDSEGDLEMDHSGMTHG